MWKTTAGITQGKRANKRQKTVALARPASNLSINGEINK
jgi:hypothetical protein